MGNKLNFQKIRRDTITKRDRSLEKYCLIFSDILQKAKISPEKMETIINADVATLVKLLNDRQITSVELVAIYGQRAATIGKRIGCITEDYFQFALGKAKECDEIRAKSKKRNWTLDEEYDSQKYLPPLFGIPVSIKDNIEMKGTLSTIGMTSKAIKPAQQDCGIIHCVKNSGMIPFVKTNLPQLALNFDSNNFLWGRCLNPWNLKKSAGGSSGGQGAIVAARISPIGIGNDMLGSVRIPASFNGVAGLMSSPGRLPINNTIAQYSTSFKGMDTVKIITGPLARQIDSIALWMKVMTTQSFYAGKSDPYVKLIPFDTKMYKEISNSTKKLKIGYLQTLQMIETSPAFNRGLLETVQYLKSQGHQLVEIHIPFERQILLLPYYEVISEGKMKTFLDQLEGERIMPEYNNFYQITNMNSWLFAGVRFLMNKLQPRVGYIVNACTKLTLHQYFEKIGRVYQIRQEWINYWRKNKLDYVISPGFGCQATDHEFSKECSLLAAYTYVWNAFGMTSCSLPVSITRQDEQYYESHWDDEFTKAIKKTMSTAAGLPVCIQVIGLPFNEEGVLGVAKNIQSHFQFSKKYSAPKLQL